MRKKIITKTLSTLLTAIMLLSCVSAGFTASAANDPWQAFAESLQSAKGLTNDAPALWDVMDSYWAAAKQVRSRETDTAREISAEVLRELIDQECLTLEELMDCNAIELLRRFEGSGGVFELSRTRDASLLDVSGSVNSIANQLVLSRRWDWNTFRRTDAEKANMKPLKKALRDWLNLFSRLRTLDKLADEIEATLAAVEEQNVTAELLAHFGLPSFAQVDNLQKQVQEQQDLAEYLPLADFFAKPKNTRWLSDKRLREELAEARENTEALTLLSRAEPEVFEALELDMQIAENYVVTLMQAMTLSDADALVAQIAGAIKGCNIDGTDYPAMTYALQKYTFNAAGLSFEEILRLYEAVVLADAALTGMIGSQANFPSYDVAAKLRTTHGINVADASAKAIAAIRGSFKTADARIAADYSIVPPGSGWTSAAPSYDYDPATTALQDLDNAGGSLLADEGKPSYERMPTNAAPVPIKIDPALTGAADTSANYVTSPDWNIAESDLQPAAPTVPVPALSSDTIAEESGFVSGIVNGITYTIYDDYLAAWVNYIVGTANYTLTGTPPILPAATASMQSYLSQAQADYNTAYAACQTALTDRAKWSFTQAAYTWVDQYEATDHPAVPNTATPPQDNSVRQNDAYPISDGYTEKYDYLAALQTRFRLELIYVMEKDTALQTPENAYRWLQCRWHDYDTMPGDQGYYDFVTAVNTYFSLLQRNADGTYADQNGAFVPQGVNELITDARAAQRRIEIINGYGAFFHAYRLDLDPEDFVRYSNSDLRAELAATEAKIAQFEKYFPDESMPAAWTDYLEIVRQAMKARVFTDMNSLNGNAEDIAKEYSASTLMPKPGSSYTYNFSNLELWESIKAHFTLSPAEDTLLALAQEVYAYLKGSLYSQETLHWELNAGQNAIYGSDWLPERGLKDPIVLKAGQDEFQVEYEHVEVLIDKLDTLLTSNYFKENAEFNGAPPAFVLPELDAGFVVRLGELRSSAGGLVVEDPSTGITITLPPLPTVRDTTRVTSETSRTTARRSWIQAYRADVLLYLMHTMFEAIKTDSDLGAAEFLGWLLSQVLPGSEQGGAVNELTGTAVIEGVNNALADIDLSAAVRPFFTELLSSAVNENLLNDKLPNTILGLYGTIAEVLRPVFAGQLLINPATPGGSGLIPDTRFASLPGLDLTLGYVLEEITGKSRYRITVSDLAEHPTFVDLFGGGGATLPELFLGAQLTPKDLAEICWPAEWPTTTATAPAGAPAYVSDIAQELSDIYTFLNTPENFHAGQNDVITSWQGCEISFDWGFVNISDPARKRQAFEDVTAFSMSGISLLLSCVFGNTPLQMNIEGTPAAYLNSGAPGPQSADDHWYNDLRIGLASVTEGINKIIQDAVGVLNAVIDLLNAPAELINNLLPEGIQLPLIPQVSFPELKLPDVAVSKYTGEASYTGNDGNFHWRGQFDSRVGMESKLSAVNAYGKIVIPFFELLDIAPLLSEAEFNTAVAVPNAGELVQATDKTALRETLHKVSQTITEALTRPLLNWLAPLDDSLVPDSLGYRPVEKTLNLLPNLAYMTERSLPAALLNDVLDGLTLDVTLYLGGLSGEAVQGLQKMMIEYSTENIFELNYYYDLFSTILPDLVNFGPLLDRILTEAGSGLAFIFAQPLAKLALLRDVEDAYSKLFHNRNDGNDNEDNFLTVLDGVASTQPGNGVREASLGSLIGFFAGDSAANSLSFNLFGANGLPLGNQLSQRMTANIGYCDTHEAQHPKNIMGWLHHQTGIAIGGNLTELLNGLLTNLFPDSEKESDSYEQMTYAVKDAAKNTPQLEGFLVELFNPQTYPVTDFMQYALLDTAQAAPPNNIFNPVQYSDKWNAKWTPKKADYLAGHLNPFLDSLSEYMLGREFAPWLQEQLSNCFGFDIQHPYNAKNLNALLDKISDLLGGWSFDATIRAKADAIPDDDREAFSAVLIEALQPLAPTLKICLTGGRTETDSSIKKAGNNLTFLEDTLGFSGYDGYKHALIPLYEHLGVPQDELPDYDEFVTRATAPTGGDEAFFQMLIDPLLNLYERVAADPLNELLQLMPNMIYFFAAEDEHGDNFSQCLNRLLRPVSAALDMVTPMLPAADAFALLGIPYPINFDIAGTMYELRLPSDLSANSILIGLMQGFIANFSDKVGLNITLAISDLTDLVTGELQVYTSKSGQTDAVKMESYLPDFLTNLLRKLIVLIFTEENYTEFRKFIEERLPDNRRKIGLFFLDSCAKSMRKTLNKSDGADRVLNLFYTKFVVTEHTVNIKLWFRELASKISIWWYSLLANSKISFIRNFANWRLERLKENYFTLEDGWKPNGIIGMFRQSLQQFAAKFPKLSGWILSLVEWLFPVETGLLNDPLSTPPSDTPTATITTWFYAAVLRAFAAILLLPFFAGGLWMFS